MKTVQAAETSYELHTLGWKAFQQLCISITGEVWGQTVQGFFDSHDGGRDGAFHGKWILKDSEIYEGAFTVQCKFFAQPNKTIHLSDLREELGKAARLAARGLADNYFLLTNGQLTGISDESIRAEFEAISGIKKFAAYGVERISQFIRESPRLRMLVPRVYGLGDLSQILDERAYAQAREILSALGDDLEKFVITDAYQRAAKSLVQHGFVLLLGEPACGKSTIAAALAVGALDEWSCFTLKIRDADDFVKHSNPNEPKQFFWIDDAFGATQLDWHGTQRWNSVLPHIQAAIRRGARVIFTSRNYIYRSARNLLKESAFPLINESQVVIRVDQLTNEEREQILYNHIRLGAQPNSFKSAIKPYLHKAVSHLNFSPEIARRLGNPAFTKRMKVSGAGLETFISHPMEFLQEIIKTLDANSRSAIALVFIRGGSLPSPIALTQEECRAITLIGGSESAVRNSFEALEGSLLIQVQQSSAFFWRFKHPTIRDAFASLIAENRELLDIYVAGTPLLQLFDEITCGDVGLEGVKVIVPEDRYHMLISRIQKFLTERQKDKNRLYQFLASRCEKGFLQEFILVVPGFIEALRVGSYLYAVSDVAVIVRLHEFGLLPETERLRHIAAIRELAVEVPDSGFLRQDVRRLFSLEELKETLGYVRSNLLLDLNACVESWCGNYDKSEEPSVYFSELRDTLNNYKEAFSDDDYAVLCIDGGIEAIDKAIDRMDSEAPHEPDVDDYYGNKAPTGEPSDSRSIFDDVDQ